MRTRVAKSRCFSRCFEGLRSGLNSCFGWIQAKLRCLRRRKTYETIVDIVKLSSYIPGVLYTTDFRLVFILTTIYISLVTQFRKAANSEADSEMQSGRLFTISPEWPNHSISGGVSDRVLWICRANSETAVYYRIIYFGLISVYALVVIIYPVVKVVLSIMVAHLAFKLYYGPTGKKVRYLEVVANGLKSLHQLHDRLKKERDKARENEEVRDNFNTTIKSLAKEWNIKWVKLTRRTKESHYLYNWLIVLYLIPRYETLIILMILTFSLTSYDIHPIGCLSPINVSYNETEMSVILTVSENVLTYQRISVVMIIILAIHWTAVKVFQFLLLPRAGWGLRINKVRNSIQENESNKGCNSHDQPKNKENKHVDKSKRHLESKREIHPKNEQEIYPDEIQPQNEHDIQPLNGNEICLENEHKIHPENEHRIHPKNEHGIHPKNEHGIHPNGIYPENEHGICPDNQHEIQPHEIQPKNKHAVQPDEYEEQSKNEYDYQPPRCSIKICNWSISWYRSFARERHLTTPDVNETVIQNEHEMHAQDTVA